MGVLRIGELSRRTGVSPELLRAWELRYALLSPERSAGGFRLYSDEDEARVRRMTSLLASGRATAEAAREAREAVSLPVRVPSQPSHVGDLAARLRLALDRLDGSDAHAALDSLFASLSVEAALVEVLLPYLRELGDRWAIGTASVAQEHFASNLIRGRLLGLARDWDSGVGPCVLLACLPEEEHDLGLIAFGLLVHRRGCRVAFLGAKTPFQTLGEAVHDLQPEVTVLATVAPDAVQRHTRNIRHAARRSPLVLAAPINATTTRALGARLLPSDIPSAALQLARELTERSSV